MSSLTNKIKSAVAAHPRLAVLGIGLAVTFGVTIALGFANSEQAFAGSDGCIGCRNLN